MRALWPSLARLRRIRLISMRVQTVAIMAVGFALAQLAGYWLYSLDRRGAIEMTEALDIAERAAGLSRLLRDLPPEWATPVALASDSRAFRVWISEAPAFDVVEPTRDEVDIEAYLRLQVPRIAKNDMRVRFARASEQQFVPPERPADAPPRADPLPAKDAKLVSITMNHPSGVWVNFVGGINTPETLLPEFLGMSLFSAALGIGLVAFWLVHRVTVPLTRLADAAETLGKNIRAAPLEESGPAEVARAAAAFNRMQRRLGRLIETRTELLAGISHDLRTPITQLRLRTELMNQTPERAKNLAALDEMEATIGTFLAFARASGDREERSQVDIGALVESVCSDFSDGGADVTCEQQDGLVIGCRRLAVKRAVTNLIGNALKYGHRARVGVRGADRQIVIRVDDDGPGIPEDEIETVFQPFRRGDASRGPDSGGYGLGLSIAQAIAEDHGGRVRLANRPEGGLRAEMTLPV